MSVEEAQRRIAALDGVAACTVREASAGTPWSRSVLVMLEVPQARLPEAGRIATAALRALREAHSAVQGGRLRISWRDAEGVVHGTRPAEWLAGSALEGARRAATDVIFTRAWLDETVPA